MPVETAYCTLRDVFTFGLGPDALAAPRLRPIEAVFADAGVLRLTGGGFFDGDPLTFVVQGSPIEGETAPQLPSGLSDAVEYQAVPVGDSLDLFQVRIGSGAPIASFGDQGTGVFSVSQSPRLVIEAMCLDESSQVDDALTANAPPILRDADTGKYPQVVVGVVARRVAIRAALRFGLSNPGFQASLDRLIDGEALDNRRLDDWIKGRPINIRPADQTAELENAALAGRSAAPTNWRTGTL